MLWRLRVAQGAQQRASGAWMEGIRGAHWVWGDRGGLPRRSTRLPAPGIVSCCWGRISWNAVGLVLAAGKDVAEHHSFAYATLLHTGALLVVDGR